MKRQVDTSDCRYSTSQSNRINCHSASGTAGRTQLNLAWTANTEPDLNHYNVYRGTVQGFPVTPGTTVPIATPTTNSYMNTGLTPSTTYYYRVAAVDNAGIIGPLSDERVGSTSADTTPPAKVTGLTVTRASGTAKYNPAKLSMDCKHRTRS